MKKIILLIAFLTVVSAASNAQVLFNGASTLKSGNWCVGIDPMVATEYDNDFALFIHGGYGLGNNSDLNLKLGFGWGNDTYFAFDYEKAIVVGKPTFSISGGLHYWRYVGLDFGGLITFPINNTVHLTTGLNIDVTFGEDANEDTDIWVPVWLPLNCEIFVQKNLSIVIEGNVKLTDDAFTTFGGGINFYF